MTKRATIAIAWTSAAAGRIHHSTSPAADPNVPGATGAYPTPSTVATSSAGGREGFFGSTGGRESFSGSAIGTDYGEKLEKRGSGVESETPCRHALRGVGKGFRRPHSTGYRKSS